MERRPNILVIMSDQQRADSLGCYGNVFINSPRLDAFAEQGVLFKNAFTPFPLCTPARAAMWTGVYPATNGITDCVYGIEDAFTASAYPATAFGRLKAAGYVVGYFGKWHLGNRRPPEMDHWQGFNSARGHWVDGKQWFQDGTYAPDVQTDEMIELLASFDTNSPPFFLVQSYYPPHEPYLAPKRYLDLYRGKGIFRPGYYAAVSALDDCVGRILESLEGCGFSDNTLVIYTSDHGEHFNYRAKEHKTTGHDDSIRIPMIVRSPDCHEAGNRLDDPVGLQDLVPTLLDYAGCEAPDYIHGKSLRPCIEGREREKRTGYYVQNVEDFRTSEQWAHIYTTEYGPDSRDYHSPDGEWDRQRAIWTADWKLVLSEAGNHLLYDLVVDPEEELNLYGAPKADPDDQYRHFLDQTPVMRRLTLELKEEAMRINDTLGIELADQLLIDIDQFGGKT